MEVGVVHERFAGFGDGGSVEGGARVGDVADYV